jgi:hypothetical protein
VERVVADVTASVPGNLVEDAAGRGRETLEPSRLLAPPGGRPEDACGLECAFGLAQLDEDRRLLLGCVVKAQQDDRVLRMDARVLHPHELGSRGVQLALLLVTTSVVIAQDKPEDEPDSRVAPREAQEGR